MRRLASILASLVIVLGFAAPSSAELYNVQSVYDNNDFGYIYSGADIEYFSVFESTDFPGDLFVVTYFNGWVGSSRGMGSDYMFVYFDIDGDGTEDYYLISPDAYLPAGGEDALMYRASDYSIVAGCEAIAFVSGGFSSYDDNYYGFYFQKDCLPFSSSTNIQVLSNYLGDFDYTQYGTFETGASQQLAANFDKPSAKPLLAFNTVSPAKEPADLVALSPQLLKSVVQVYCANGVGSGWVADVSMPASAENSGYKSAIITNHHVVEDCLRSGAVSVVDSEGTTHAGVVFASDSQNDLAGVFIQNPLPSLRWQGEEPAQGWWAGVLGSPSQISGYLTTGIIGLVERSSGLISVTAPIRPGNSGGPVFDREGRVVGVATAYLPGYENINVAGGVHLLCEEIISCSSSNMVWSKSLQDAPAEEASVDAPPAELGDETVDGGVLVQRAGSQVFITSADLQGDFEIYEDGELIDSFTFDGVAQAYIVEQRVTGGIQIRQIINGVASLVAYDFTKTLLWFQNVNLGSFSETDLGSSARDKVSNLVNHRYSDSGNWKQRDSEVTKFICTGIYREGGSAAEKLSARKKAKLACESAKVLDNDPNSQVSFFYQTKPTKAASYVGKVLVTVKGIEPFVASRIN